VIETVAAPVAAAPTARPSHGALAVVVLVLVALAARAGALWLARDARTWNDGVTYVQRALDLMHGEGYTGSYQPWVRNPGERRLANLERAVGAYQAPGYSAFIALVCLASGTEPRIEQLDPAAPVSKRKTGEEYLYDVHAPAVQIAQVLLGAATAWLVYRLGLAWFGRRAGLVAGWLYALDPTFVAFTHYFFNETLFVFLFTAGLLLAFGPRRVPSIGSSITIGVLFALAAYVKSSLLFLLPVLALALILFREGERRAALRSVAIAAAAWLACIAPWTARNWEVHGGFVLMDSSGPFNFWRGNQPRAYVRRRFGSDWNVHFAEPFHAWSQSPVSEVGGREFLDQVREHVEQPTDLQVMEVGTKVAVDYIREQPAWFLERAWYKLVDLWNPTSFVMRHLEKRGYGPISRGTELALSWACVLSYLVAAGFGAIGLWKVCNDERGKLVLLLIGYYTAIHVVTFALTRFRLPILPLLMVLAGFAIVLAWDRWRGARDVSEARRAA
jgi:4-amino-4-deoxy-L-arabinose transferase-like glycosyltransferase